MSPIKASILLVVLSLVMIGILIGINTEMLPQLLHKIWDSIFGQVDSAFDWMKSSK
ncbi:hypothetical protein [Paenibacillus larvae]|uniref:Uncharacterized protein n=1 Tax=Paenibacillus larvae subsp. larvae TaxID=147375 RepID=A0A6C0QXQ0_9BACL|nr:hypothetical protein [Paenibacillus larvae]MCY9500070.1 hypothetical protein [Paenibacillus larvae]MDR5566962.1 hypothetical protein [Paenibacillus larvae]MDR5595043.1 hypothetical protein [Paenibacillus larvae]QHZ53360.1 hypothetical protein ERICV_04309 [Paenibacillus larvae subsp. larvae]